ncbi:MAG: Txe/YoeB family addiction module toxin [Selenomonadaceae bacterium]|nr:Txe/YoeB family addiction module toxin [Selenomonadaceae bacterium]
MNILWKEKAWLEYLYWQTQDKKTLRKINNLLKDIERNGYNCIGKPEPLRDELSGWWSVRIDEKNRLIFKIENEIVEITQCGTHYGQWH